MRRVSCILGWFVVLPFVVLPMGACSLVLAGHGYDFSGEGGAGGGGFGAAGGGDGGAGGSGQGGSGQGGSGPGGEGGDGGGATCDGLTPPAFCAVLSAGLPNDGVRGCSCGDCPGMGDGGAGGACVDATAGGPTNAPRAARTIGHESFCDADAPAVDLALRGWETTNFAGGPCAESTSTLGMCDGWLQISPSQKTVWADTQGPMLSQRVTGDFGVVTRVAVAFSNPASRGVYAGAALIVRSVVDPHTWTLVDFGMQLNHVGVAAYVGGADCPIGEGPQIPANITAPTVRLGFCRVGGVLRTLSDVGAGLAPVLPDASGFFDDVDVGPSAQWYLGGNGVHALFDTIAFVAPTSMSDCVTQLEGLAR